MALRGLPAVVMSAVGAQTSTPLPTPAKAMSMSAHEQAQLFAYQMLMDDIRSRITWQVVSARLATTFPICMESEAYRLFKEHIQAVVLAETVTRVLMDWEIKLVMSPTAATLQLVRKVQQDRVKAMVNSITDECWRNDVTTNRAWLEKERPLIKQALCASLVPVDELHGLRRQHNQELAAQLQLTSAWQQKCEALLQENAMLRREAEQTKKPAAAAAAAAVAAAVTPPTAALEKEEEEDDHNIVAHIASPPSPCALLLLGKRRADTPEDEQEVGFTRCVRQRTH
jgi:hypothetical protein